MWSRGFFGFVVSEVGSGSREGAPGSVALSSALGCGFQCSPISALGIAVDRSSRSPWADQPLASRPRGISRAPGAPAHSVSTARVRMICPRARLGADAVGGAPRSSPRIHTLCGGSRPGEEADGDVREDLFTARADGLAVGAWTRCRRWTPGRAPGPPRGAGTTRPSSAPSVDVASARTRAAWRTGTHRGSSNAAARPRPSAREARPEDHRVAEQARRSPP